MRIQSVEISNMFCFDNGQELIFKDPVYQIVGERDGVENQSNGTGKSSIYYAIQEVLFGKNIKGTLKDYTGNVFTNPNSYSGVVNFSHNSNNYSVKLARKSGKATLTLLENGVDISDHTMPKTYKAISEILGVDYELFTMLTYLSPTISTPNILFFGTPKEKLMLFTKLFGYEDMLKRVDKAKEIAKDQNIEIATVERQLKAEKLIEVPAEPARPEFPDLEDRKQRLSDVQIKIKALRGQLEATSSWTKFNDEKSKLTVDIAFLEERYESYDDTKFKYYKAAVDSFTTELSNLKYAQKRLSGANEFCPTCGAKIESYDHIMKEMKELNESIQKVTNKLQSATTSLEEHKGRLMIHERLQKLRERLEEVQLFLDSQEFSDIEVDAAEHTLANMEQTVVLLKDYIQTAEAKILAYEKEKSNRDLLIKMREEQVKKIESLEQSLVDLKSDSKYYNTIVEHLGLSGFISTKIQSKAEQLTSLINDYLSSFSNGTLTIRLLGGNKLNYKLLKDNKELPTNNLSAGQTTMLQLSSILALRDLVNASKGVVIDLLVLDELFGTLDEIRRGILIDTIRDISLKGGHKVLSISHLHYDPAIPTIVVQQKDGVSKIIQ